MTKIKVSPTDIPTGIINQQLTVDQVRLNYYRFKTLVELLDNSNHRPEYPCSAVLGGDNQQYRYILRRTWDESLPKVLFIMLNPSQASEIIDDPTVRICIGRASRLNYGGIVVVNLFAYRATLPSDLYNRKLFPPMEWGIGITGPENNKYIINQLKDISNKLIICAWGNHGKLFARGDYVKNLIINNSHTPYILKLTRENQPAHPLRIGYDILPQEWKP